MNGLASVYGKYLKHQSDRDLPDTHFAKGIQKGKLMAKQYRGVMLLMAAILRSSTAAEQLGVILELSCQWQIPQKVVFKIWSYIWQVVFGSCFDCRAPFL